MADEKTYSVRFKNERRTGITLYDRVGAEMGVIGPGGHCQLEFWTEDNPYSPFSEVVFKADGSIETTQNPDFPAPKSRWLLQVLNIDGAELERRIVAHREVILPKGLERTFEIEPHDPLSIFSRMEIRRVIVRDENGRFDFPQYSRFVPKLEDIFIDRAPAELVELETELRKLAEGA